MKDKDKHWKLINLKDQIWILDKLEKKAHAHNNNTNWGTVDWALAWLSI